MLRSEPVAVIATLDYWELFRELPESYMLLSAEAPDYTIIEVNKAREALVGVSREDSVGQPLSKVFPVIYDRMHGVTIDEVLAQLEEVVRTGKSKHLKSFRFDQKNKDGTMQTRYWQSTYHPVRFDGKQITHILAVTRDVTEAQRSRQHVTSVEGRLETALAMGRVGSWVWNLETDEIVSDTTMARIFGVPSAQAAKGLPSSAFTGVIHRADVKRVRAALNQAIKDGSLFEQEYRTTGKNGKLHSVIARGQVQEYNGHLTFPGVVVDITEQRDLQAQIELARQQDRLNQQAAKILQDRNAELEAVSRTKDEFVALASHQLRTPATAVKQYLGMVLQGYAGDISTVQRDMLEKAFESNERQIQIINQILNAARVDTGRLMLAPTPLDLHSLAQGIADDMRLMFEQHEHSFTLQAPRQPLPIIGDLGYLRMAIENILHNAVLYTPKGGQVNLRLSRAGKNCRLEVTDTGVGIRKSDLGKLFVKFSRIHNPLSVQAGGSGIGLYLAAEIIRLHGGSVSVESELHKGSTFAILLPLVQNKR